MPVRGRTTRSPLPKALVTDVDGTLTDERRRFDPNAVLALRSLERKGVPVLLATGNVLPIALAFHRSLGLTGPIVAENGGLWYDRVDGHEVVRSMCDVRPALAAYRKLVASGLPVRRLFTDRWRETEVALEATVPVTRVRAAIRGMGVDVEATGFALHLMEHGAGKLPTVRAALASRGIAPADCWVAGDGDNDVPMLRALGYSMSFANGSPRARAAADFVASHGYARGFVEALKRATSLGPRGSGGPDARR